MILSVDHTISQGSFETVLTGIRQTIYSLPQLDDYLQTLKVNLLQSIIETTLTQERQNAATATTQTSGNILNETAQIGSTITEQYANQISSGISEKCKPNEKYSSYTPIGEPKNTKINYSDIYDYITILTSNQTLQYLIFSTFYIASGKNYGFDTYENNFAGITIDQYWGNTGDAYFSPDRKFYCSVKDVPYAKFPTVEKSIEFLIAKWSGRIGTLTVTDENLAKFWALNANQSITNNENIWTSLPQESKDLVINDFREAIQIFQAMELQ